jgi:hydroxymethylpyrimidine pyrophosphatase-like HAD family hydrolase
MRYVCLACDYDGTIARNGAVAQSTVAALQRVKTSGRRLVLVTGRELGDLLSVFERPDLFDRIVAENGGVRTPRSRFANTQPTSAAGYPDRRPRPLICIWLLVSP